MTRTDILRAYRHLYRAARRATHYATPAKYIIRHTMRTSFRSGCPLDFNLKTMQNTEAFLERAEQDTGMEHRVLKNLLHVRYWQHQVKRENRLITKQTALASQIRKENWAQFDATLALFNNSMGICLR